MNGTERFKETIKTYLDRQAESDPLFAEVYKKESKNIDDCIKFILSEVKNSGCCGFADEEIYGLALHYYQEDNIEVKDICKCQVIVNHQVELTAEEKAEAKRQAMDKLIREETERLRKPKPQPKKPQAKEPQSQTLFNLFDNESED